MLFVTTILLIAQQQNLQPRDSGSEPPFWWIGLFASPGGLIIVGVIVAGIVLLVLAVRHEFRKGRDT
jgi:hypothetical protein